jgi:hypothetical protein
MEGVFFMKALKEKRINLQSLWRRSLVILSVLALAFAACGDSSSSNKDVVVPVRIVYSGNGTAINYQGYAPDLAGFTFAVEYSDGSTRTFTDTRQFVVTPRFITGTYSATDNLVFVPDVNFTVSYGQAQTIVPLPAANIRALVRTPLAGTPEFDSAYNPTNQNFLLASGLQIHGAPQMQRTYYVDDRPNFNRLRAEALYWVDRERNITEVKEFNLVDKARIGAVQGIIHPLYNASPRTATGTGILYITFARHPRFDPNEGVYAQSGGNTIGVDRDVTGTAGTDFDYILSVLRADAGVTVALPLDEVWHVHEFAFENTPAVDAIFYWQANWQTDRWRMATNPWLSRIAGATFRVTYSNGRSYVRSLDFLLNAPEVWWNRNDAGSVAVPQPAPVQLSTSRAFWIVPPPFPQGNNGVRTVGGTDVAEFPNGTGPQVLSLYYRGYTIPLPVKIWNRLDRIEAVPIEPGAININMAVGGQDNDNITLGGAANDRQFAGLFNVRAHFSELQDPDSVIDIPLTYNFAYARALGLASNPPNNALVPDPSTVARPASIAAISVPGTNSITTANLGRTYTMNFGEYRRTLVNLPASITDNGWGHSSYVLNNDETSTVTFWYFAPSVAWPGLDIAPALHGLQDMHIFDGNDEHTAEVTVGWTGIAAYVP